MIHLEIPSRYFSSIAPRRSFISSDWKCSSGRALLTMTFVARRLMSLSLLWWFLSAWRVVIQLSTATFFLLSRKARKRALSRSFLHLSWLQRTYLVGNSTPCSIRTTWWRSNDFSSGCLTTFLKKRLLWENKNYLPFNRSNTWCFLAYNVHKLFPFLFFRQFFPH